MVGLANRIARLTSQAASLRGDALVLFGTAGIPHSAKARSSVAGIARIRALGLGAMELLFVRRVAMGQQTACAVRRAAEENQVRLSAHAPYYINFNSIDPAKVTASRERLLAAARVASACGARNVVFHPAFYHHDPTAAYERVKAQLIRIARQVRDEGLDVCLRPETMGKPSQFGELAETVRLSAEIEGVSPCIDFGHLHARSGGGVNTCADFEAVLDCIQESLGKEALQDMHMHVQGIAYTSKGEQRHLDLSAADFRYEDLLQVLADRGVCGTVICESPNLEDDALLLRRTYLLCTARGESSSKALVP